MTIEALINRIYALLGSVTLPDEGFTREERAYREGYEQALTDVLDRFEQLDVELVEGGEYGREG